MAWEDLAEKYPWPEKRPDVEIDWQGWFDSGHVSLLGPLIRKNPDSVLIELGSWKGKSTRWFLKNFPRLRVVAVDHWEGSVEHKKGPWKKDLPRLYDTFISNCWGYRDRLIPLRTDTIKGLHLCDDAEIKPHLIYVDAAHDFQSVLTDVKTSLALFPRAIVTGDDYPHPPVQKAIKQIQEEQQCRLRVKGRCWAFR